MAKKGQILIDPESGNSFEFIETAKDTNGEKVAVKMTIISKGKLVPDHFHTLQDEQFEVISGKLTYHLDDKINILSENQSIILPKGKPHNHYNMEVQPLVFVQTVRPALDFEMLVENIVGLTTDGKMKKGKAGLLQELVTLKYLDSKAFLADIPVPVQKFLMHTLAPIARFFGYRAVYPKYSGVEK